MSVLQPPAPRNRRAVPGFGYRCLLVTAAALLVSTGLAGCSDGEAGSTPEPSSTGSPGTDPGTTLSGSPTPTGPVLATPGEVLGFGESAKVAATGRKGEGVLKLTVTGLQKATWGLFEGWKVGKQLRTHRPYFVQVTVRNVGEKNLGGTAVPLHVLDAQDRLVEASSFADVFRPCPSTTLPAPFKPGAKTTRCLVFLVPDGASVSAVVHQVSADADLVRWTGPTTVWKKPGEKGKKGNAKKNGKKAESKQ